MKERKLSKEECKIQSDGRASESTKGGGSSGITSSDEEQQNTQS